MAADAQPPSRRIFARSGRLRFCKRPLDVNSLVFTDPGNNGSCRDCFRNNGYNSELSQGQANLGIYFKF